MAVAVANAIAGGGVLAVEAGTGTGKTFAYLVPALLCGGRVVVSTGTRTLQDQLFQRDLPAVRDALGIPVTASILKGRSNYVCHHHLKRNLAEGRFERREEIAELRRIERFAAMSVSGDRSELAGIPEEAPVWGRATSTRDNCLGQDCPEIDRCFVIKARQSAQQADVVVVNHHLFCADLALREEGVAELLPSAATVIFDEAHQLPAIAANFFGDSFSTRQLLDFSRDCLRLGMADAADAADWIGLVGTIEHALRQWRLAAGRPGRRDVTQLRGDAGHREALACVLVGLGAADDVLAGAAQRSRDLSRLALRAEVLRSRLTTWLARLEPGFVPDPEDESVLWCEVHQSGVTLHATPLSVAPVFRRQRETSLRSCVFASATLAVGGDFSHFTDAIGMPDAVTLALGSPFDYASNARLLVPSGCGDPADEGFARRLVDCCWPLIVANGGRAFLLCTSLRMVDRIAGLVRASGQPDLSGIELLVQGSAPRAALLERFRQAAHPLLIGSASFWEGVDVVGRQLSLVIIDKLPFAPPDDPVLSARIELLRRRGEDPFSTIQLPAAAMALKQGAGRLIRSEQDRGLLVVCDDRLVTRGYGRRLIRSLPPFPLIRDPAEAVAWLADGR
jgi:ATP-dependent DNA helicase DinG